MTKKENSVHLNKPITSPGKDDTVCRFEQKKVLKFVYFERIIFLVFIFRRQESEKVLYASEVNSVIKARG